MALNQSTAIVDGLNLSDAVSQSITTGEHRSPLFSSDESEKARPVHSTSRKLFKKCNGRLNSIRYIPIFGIAIECYGPLLIFVLCFSYFLFKGVAYHILSLSLNSMFTKHFDCSTLDYSRFRTVSVMGFSIKPITALISDSFAVYGYKKRWILTGSAIMAAGAALSFALLPGKRSNAQAGAGLAFLSGYGYANLDILLEGLYARRIRQFPSGGPSMVSATYIPQMIGSIVASFVQGPSADAGIPWAGNVVAAGCAALCIVPLALNWAGEDTNRFERREDAIEVSKQARAEEEPFEEAVGIAANEKAVDSTLPSSPTGQSSVDDVDEEYEIPTFCGGAVEFNKEVILRNYRITVFCIVMTMVVVATAIITTLYGGYPLLAACIIGSAILIFLMFWALPFVVAKAALYAYICQALYVNTAAPLEGFYLADESCLPGGPHFTYFFYNTISGVIGNLTGLIGVLGFAYIFSKMSYRVTFIITVLAEIVGSIFDLIMVKRWNIDIGIPDHYMYVFGDAVIYQVAYWLAWMPMVLLLAQLCPKGSEAMVYSLLVSIFNFGTTLSGEIGTLLMEWVWPVTSKGTCDFSNLWKLVILGHMGLPILIVVSTFFLIPASKVSEALDHSGKTLSSSEGYSEGSDSNTLGEPCIEHGEK